MPWQDRQRQAALTTEDGTRFVFLFEDLDRSRAENTSVFKFLQKNGAFIQRLSSGQGIYPLTVIFSGEDYDLISEDFWKKTEGNGVLLLEHPRFVGLKRVQILSIRQRVAAKTADNQSTFDIVLHETLDITLPETAEDATAEILSTANELNAAAAAAFADNAELDDTLFVTDLQIESQSFLDSVKDGFTDLVAKSKALNAAFEAQYLSATAAVNNMVEGALEFADNAALLVSTPSRILGSIEAYKKLASNTINRLQWGADDLKEAAKNNGALAVLSSLGIISGMCQSSVTSAEYPSRSEVILTVDAITSVVADAIEQIDGFSAGIGNEVNPADRRFEITDALNILNDLQALTTGRLFQVAFTLKQERFITLNRDRDPVTLTHELYGYSDENLDLLINTNRLRGDALFIIPQGTEIVYYI